MITNVLPPFYGSQCISGTMTDSVEIPTAILGFSTMSNFYAIYRSSRNINISGLGDHIAISGSRSLSQSFGELSLNSSWSKTAELLLEFRRYLS